MYDTLTLHTDGGARGNPGPAAIGVVIAHHHTTLHASGLYLGETTNNVAEYLGLINGLTTTLQLFPTTALEVYMDSELVVRQLCGQYAVKQAHLLPLHTQASRLLARFSTTSLTHIKRADNSAADTLVNTTLDLVLTS